LLQTELNVASKNLLVVLYGVHAGNDHESYNIINTDNISLSWKSKYTMKLYGKMFTSEVDMQHLKKDFYKRHFL